MESYKKNIFLFLIASLTFFFSYCTKKYNEPAPFFDGLFLEYRAGSIRRVYNIQVLDNNQFKIVETEKSKILISDVEELLVDTYGKVYESTYKEYKGKISPIWVPAHKMEIGDIFDGQTVIRKEKWKKWEVLVIKDPTFEVERYFELNTGFWVGSFARTPIGASEVVLVNTNANIPVAE